MKQARSKPERCSGSGKEPRHTYVEPVRGSGGVVRPQVLANCPVNHDGHHGLFLVGGKVQDHER